MGDINQPIQPIQPPSEGGWEHVQQIEGYKQKGKHPTPGEEPSETHVLAIALSLLKESLSFAKKKQAVVVNKQEITNNLSKFHNTLQSLITGDTSHDPAFTQSLSSLWHNINEDCNQLDYALGNSHPTTVKLRLLLEEIDLYPPWEAHSLGYYLTKKAGMEWIPIPFMEILFSLHAGAKKNPFNNTLEKWIRSLDEIIHELEKPSE